MKIFLGNAPWYKDGYRGIRAGSRWPHFVDESAPYKPFPFYLAYATALLEKEGFEVMVVDALAEGIREDEYFNRMEVFAPDLVAHEVSSASFKRDIVNGRRAKEMLPKARLVLCGPHAGMYEPEFLDEAPFVDYVIRGEYEFSLLELAKALRDGDEPEAVRGINYRAGEMVTRNPNRELTPLAQFPWPNRESLPMDKYCDNPFEMPSPSLQIHTSRGCPFTCTFCAWPQVMYGGNKYRYRDAKDIVDELFWCKEKFGIKSFYIDDDTFNIGKKRILEFCSEIIKRELNLPWSVMARADTADDEMLLSLKKAGLHSIKYGIESGDQEILDKVGKNLDLSVAEKTVIRTKELGIKFHLTFLFGLPGETWETVNKTIALADRLDPDSIQFSIVTPFPGSNLYKEMVGKGLLITDDLDEYDGNNKAVVRSEELSPSDLEQILKSASRNWHRKTFLRRLLGNKLYYLKEFIKRPFFYLKMFQRTVISGR